MINKVSLTSSSNSQNIFSIIQNRGIYNPQELSIISNNLNKFNINNETYYFNRRMKSRFFNKEKTEESTENNFKSFSTNSDSHSNKSETKNKKNKIEKSIQLQTKFSTSQSTLNKKKTKSNSNSCNNENDSINFKNIECPEELHFYFVCIYQNRKDIEKKFEIN